MSVTRLENPVFVALDTPDLNRAREVARAVRPYVGGFKIGLEFISALGPDGIRAIVELGAPVFADVKFHDIPNTVAGASRALASLGVSIFNIHASGGEPMMRAAVDATSGANPRPKIIGVTVLTSLDDQVLETVGQQPPAAEQVVRLAKLAKKSGLDGVVCSPREIALVRAACGPQFLIVTPGVRPVGADLADQRRVETPEAAVRAGADILVIGRPLFAAADPAAAARAIAESLKPEKVA
jgi:orotidine-5'-phosphate decarboxylase